jgi:hypothetical protein
VADILEGDPTMSEPGPLTKKIASQYFARFGTWPAGLILVLGSDPIPPDLIEAAQRLRKVWLRVETEKALRDELNPPKQKTVTWTTETGEVVSIDGFEAPEDSQEDDAD